ncbi:hypothetical protein ACN27F_29885 [Solwaraspora sp. WMMB335]|uniref:hypothetical protein n=1 Tax=Solwaraspora sp. WMMB335 TaxID=3404118 RepID=UPI003B94C6CD
MVTRRWLAAGAGLALLAGGIAGCGTGTPSDDGGILTAGPGSASATATSAATTDPTGSPPPESTVPGDFPEVLSGSRQVTIVRTAAFESGLSLTDDGELVEVDGDEGRQLFVPIPLDGRLFLIEAYYSDSDTAGDPACWRVRNPGNGQSLSVEAAACDAGDPRQRFDIRVPVTGGTDPAGADSDGTAAGSDADTFVISNSWAYLRHSSRSGLILEEQGDGSPPPDTFRFTDNGPAPTR